MNMDHEALGNAQLTEQGDLKKQFIEYGRACLSKIRGNENVQGDDFRGFLKNSNPNKDEEKLWELLNERHESLRIYHQCLKSPYRHTYEDYFDVKKMKFEINAREIELCIVSHWAEEQKNIKKQRELREKCDELSHVIWSLSLKKDILIEEKHLTGLRLELAEIDLRIKRNCYYFIDKSEEIKTWKQRDIAEQEKKIQSLRDRLNKKKPSEDPF